jgi:hypothetical protein
MGLHADYAAVVEANGSQGFSFGPILADFEQMAIVARDADPGFGRPKHRVKLAGSGADFDARDILYGGFLDHRRRDYGYHRLRYDWRGDLSFGINGVFSPACRVMG